MVEKRISIGNAIVIKNSCLKSGIWELVLEPPDDIEVADFDPGQFVCLAPLNPDSAMARPFSISKISTLRNEFSLVYKTVGMNTNLLTTFYPGSKLKFWGPLGNGLIPDPQKYDEVWLVGGGMGIAPMLFFEKAVLEYQAGIAKVFYGAKTKDEIVPLRWSDEEGLEIATEDGSIGYEGLVTDLFVQKILENQGKKIQVITCGPKSMMRKVSEICQCLDCFVILETIMACGIGACLGCSIKTTSGMKRVCHDGPVFPAEEVIWDELN